MNENKCMKRCGMVCLLASVLGHMLMVYAYERGALVNAHYAAPLVFAFAGMTLLSGRWKGRRELWTGAAMTAWYVLSRMLNGELYLNTSYQAFVNMCAAYLMCLPFAHAMEDGKRQTGMRWTAGVMLAGYGVLAWLAILGAVNGDNYTLPYLGTELGTNEYGRLYANTNTNISACYFMISLSLGMWLLVQQKRRILRTGILLMGTGLYIGLALSASRTAILQFSCVAAGMVLLGCLRLPLKAAWKRMLIGLAAAAACLVLVFFSFDWIAGFASDLARRMTALAAPLRQRNLAHKLATLSSRTPIFTHVFQLIKENPRVLLHGMLEGELTSRLQAAIGFYHTHNSYLQTVMVLGIPGLLMALWFTVRAVWMTVQLVFSRRAAFSDQLLALILAAVLLLTVTEPFLFTEYLSGCNIIFFLLYGYVLEAYAALKQK